ncbi:Type II secretion system protein E [Marinomonas aquimarina]|uniref:Type II secretion system protein E n=1 Tax=Marinomonas aquimarina TaxID=295068 RepID=A0A1A8TGU3_9GAMM|nr:ATPase, T2SS/T4P/T4SS family [Marinomonas aquimarina]SBS31244.1 Type II secretion system protein E [Marinomonas aquimarina]
MNLDQLLIRTIEEQASDLHLHIEQDTVSARWRVAGALSASAIFQQGSTLANRIKIMAKLNVAEARRVQEGQFDYVHNGQSYCIRVSIMRSDIGEKFALRVLTSSIKRTLQELGITSAALDDLKSTIRQPHGLVLVCGATGSGKTTTLYACLNEINDGSRAIFTIEDPVEIPTPALYQFEPNPNLEISTHDLLKAFMRQDPDVIMVGEIRDAKTADLAIAAALTGHLVLATLHTNSALNVVHRCKNWNVDYFAFASTIKLIIHQRMSYCGTQQLPVFSVLKPAWQDKLPSSYDVLIQQADMWQMLTGADL